MEESRFERVLAKMMTRVERVSSKISADFKNVKPFDTEIVPMDEQLYDYETRGYELYQQIAREQGIDAAEEWMNKMEEAKKRRKL